MRVINTVDDLRRCVIVHEGTRCWEFIKEDGSRLSPKTVPNLGRPPKQVAVIAVEVSGRVVPEGYVLRRTPHCIKFCCNPDHLSVKPSKEGERRGRRSNNPRGNPSSLLPNAGRTSGAIRSTRGKPSSNPYGRAGKPKIAPIRNDDGGYWR